MKEELIQKLADLKEKAHLSFVKAATQDELYQSKVNYLGKNGLLTEILKGLSTLSKEERPQVGQLANQLKNELEALYDSCFATIQNAAIQKSLEAESVDVTLPGVGVPLGSLHPVTQVLGEVKAVFRELGFDIFEGPEVENDYYNFEALNIPQNHPARDMQDTFYLKSDRGQDLLLRTHTSPVQIRVMENSKPPIRMVAPGAVYRRDSDVTHTPMFHQIEGLWVDKGIHFGHLKGVLETFLRKLFATDAPVRFRPSFFPFTEPSAEVDIGCVFCKSKGCRICKGTGWLEIMGCGMVDPNVFSFVKVDPEIYTGFAFGIGIERVAMLKFGINDLRLFYENDLRFLKQFA